MYYNKVNEYFRIYKKIKKMGNGRESTSYSWCYPRARS